MGFYTGLLHPFSTPAQALVMVGLGLVAGRFGAARAWMFLGAFLIASLAGVWIGSADLLPEWAYYGVAVMACAMAALVPGKGAPLALGVTVAGAALIGVASIPDAGPTSDRVITMTGSIVGANVGFLYLFGATHFIETRYPFDWVRIALRVLAAWLAAIALVMLALGYAQVPPSA